MDTPEQHELEKFIHQQLRKLPEHDAPDDLMSNVFARIKARESLPWWKQSFSFWPRSTQALSIGALSFMFAVVVYFLQRPPAVLNVNSLTERASSFGWLGRVGETLVTSLVLTFRSLPWQWLAAAAVVFFAMYAACVATGFALYRITARQSASA